MHAYIHIELITRVTRLVFPLMSASATNISSISSIFVSRFSIDAVCSSLEWYVCMYVYVCVYATNTNMVIQANTEKINTHKREYLRTNTHKRPQTFIPPYKHTQTPTNVHTSAQTHTNAHKRSYLGTNTFSEPFSISFCKLVILTTVSPSNTAPSGRK